MGSFGAISQAFFSRPTGAALVSALDPASRLFGGMCQCGLC